MRYDHPQCEAENARVALELFDLAANMLERIRGDRATQRTVSALMRRLLAARGHQLRMLDRARAQIDAEENTK